MKILHIGTKYHGENDIVNHFSEALVNAGNKVINIWLSKEVKYTFFEKVLSKFIWYWPAQLIGYDIIKKNIENNDIDVLIINSGGYYINKKTKQFLKQNKVKVVTISLSDPDVYKSQTVKQIKNTDLHFTNSLLTKKKIESKGVKCSHIVFGVSNNKINSFKVFKDRDFDIVVVGESRPEREKMISKLYEIKPNLKIACYGRGWTQFNKGYVSGKDLSIALNSGKVYVSFSRTLCGYKNIKVGMFEAMSAGCCVVSDNISVLPKDLLGDKYLISVKDENEILNVLTRLKDYDIEQIAANGKEKLFSDYTWEAKMTEVLYEIKKTTIV